MRSIESNEQTRNASKRRSVKRGLLSNNLFTYLICATTPDGHLHNYSQLATKELTSSTIRMTFPRISFQLAHSPMLAQLL